MFTPDRMSTPRVRVNFAMATLRKMGPKTGSLSMAESILQRPVRVLLHCQRASEIPTTISIMMM